MNAEVSMDVELNKSARSNLVFMLNWFLPG